MNSPDSTGRPVRDPRVEAIAHDSKWWSLLTQDLFGYAGDDPDPRPLPKRTLYSIKKKMSEYLQAGIEQQSRSDAVDKKPWAWDAFHLAFCSDRFKMPLDEVIPVPREDLWWLAAPDDLVLLSDRVTHHYTTVDQVAREAERIFFIDEWPERIFLRHGLNAAGVAAQVDSYLAGVLDGVAPGLRGKKHVSITREEFSRVAVGLISLDTPNLLDRYLEHRPEAKTSFAVRYAFGAALMDVELDRLARYAVGHFKAAWRIASASPAAGDAELAAARLYQALAIAEQVQRYAGEPLAAKPFADERCNLLASHDEARLLERLDIESVARIGNAAGHAQDFDTARRFLDRAVARDAHHEGARHLRAMVRSRQSEWQGVIDDLTAALAANSERTRRRQAERDARDPRDRHGLSDDEARLGGLRSRRLEELSLRVTACLQLQRASEAQAAAEEMVAVAPERPEGHRTLGALALQAGSTAKAQEHLRAARALEPSERGRAQIDQVLASLTTPDVGAVGG